MSDYYIKELSKDLKTVNVIFHIPIPLANNPAGISYRTAFIEYKGGTEKINSMMTDIKSDDLIKMKSGEIYERSFTVRFSSRFLSDAERLAEIKAAYVVMEKNLLDELKATLKYYGKEGTI